MVTHSRGLVFAFFVTQVPIWYIYFLSSMELMHIYVRKLRRSVNVRNPKAYFGAFRKGRSGRSYGSYGRSSRYTRRYQGSSRYSRGRSYGPSSSYGRSRGFSRTIRGRNR